MSQKIEVTGLKELMKKLEQLPIELADRVSSEANRDAGNALKKVLIGASPKRDSGRKVKIRKSVAVAKRPQTKTSFQVGFLTKAFWTRFYVFGTKSRETKKGVKTGSMPANDFVTPALESSLPKIGESLTKNYLKIIQKALKKK